MLRALTQILRHISTTEENAESSSQNVARKNFVNFVAAFAKMQSETCYQMFGRDLENGFVNLIGEITRVDPTGRWAIWMGKIHNVCSRGKNLKKVSTI